MPLGILHVVIVKAERGAACPGCQYPPPAGKFIIHSDWARRLIFGEQIGICMLALWSRAWCMCWARCPTLIVAGSNPAWPAGKPDSYITRLPENAAPCLQVKTDYYLSSSQDRHTPVFKSRQIITCLHVKTDTHLSSSQDRHTPVFKSRRIITCLQVKTDTHLSSSQDRLPQKVIAPCEAEA